MITAIASVVILLISGVLEGPEAYVGQQALYRAGMVAIFTYLLVNGYSLASRGQSLGKILTKISVASLHDGESLPAWKLWLRSVGVVFLVFIPPLGLLFVGVFLIDCLLIFNKSRRCGHDFFFGSRVINN